jgi:hypothetical protein
LNSNAQKFRTRDEMIAFLVHSNDSRVREVVTLTPDIIDWLNVMIVAETARYSTLTDARLLAACEAESQEPGRK